MYIFNKVDLLMDFKNFKVLMDIKYVTVLYYLIKLLLSHNIVIPLHNLIFVLQFSIFNRELIIIAM